MCTLLSLLSGVHQRVRIGVAGEGGETVPALTPVVIVAYWMFD